MGIFFLFKLTKYRVQYLLPTFQVTYAYYLRIYVSQKKLHNLINSCTPLCKYARMVTINHIGAEHGESLVLKNTCNFPTLTPTSCGCRKLTDSHILLQLRWEWGECDGDGGDGTNSQMGYVCEMWKGGRRWVFGDIEWRLMKRDVLCWYLNTTSQNKFKSSATSANCSIFCVFSRQCYPKNEIRTVYPQARLQDNL